VVKDDALLGLWKDKPNSNDYWRFEKGDDKAYKLTVHSDTNSSPFVAHLFTLKEQRFLNIHPASAGLENVPREMLYKVALVPGHLLFRVKQIKPSLQMEFLETDWLKNHLKKNPKVIPHYFADDDRIVLTAPTAQLQSFVAILFDNTEAWEEMDPLQRMAEDVK